MRLRSQAAGRLGHALSALGTALLLIPLPLHGLPPGAASGEQQAQQLVREMVHNDLGDREQDSFWMYQLSRMDDGHQVSEVQVETQDGPIYRVLRVDGHPLNTAEAKAERERLTHLLQDLASQKKVKASHDDDEARLRRITQLLPDAFLYNMDGQAGGVIRLRFRPNPAFVPRSFETRPFGEMAGPILLDAAQKRMIDMQAKLMDDVQFGYGLLGRLNKGGTFEIGRQPVSPAHWKTSRVDVHVSGHVILFKTVSKQQDEVRSEFRPVPAKLTLRQAVELLQQLPASTQDAAHTGN